MYIIAGLGNPGSKYENTRHNIGWLALDELARQQGVSVDRMKFHALTGQCVLNGEKVLLMKPTTYMNNSGEAIEEARSFYKIPTGNVIVISDDINLAPGKMRIRRKGGAGGHNGLKSIIQCMGTEDFPRVHGPCGLRPRQVPEVRAGRHRQGAEERGDRGGTHHRGRCQRGDEPLQLTLQLKKNGRPVLCIQDPHPKPGWGHSLLYFFFTR